MVQQRGQLSYIVLTY